MFNYREILTPRIPKRLDDYIHRYLKYSNIKFESETLIPHETISKYCRGVISKTRNPALISSNHLDIIAHHMTEHKYGSKSKDKDRFKKELFYGNESECENFIKIVLVAIIMNGCRLNPFLHFDTDRALFEFILLQRKHIDDDLYYLTLTAKSCIDHGMDYHDTTILRSTATVTEWSVAELKEKIDTFLNTHFLFFYSKENRQMYSTLTQDNEFDKQKQKMSNLLLRCVLRDVKFNLSFSQRLSLQMINNKKDVKAQVENFLMYNGSYGDIAVDYLEYDYYLFVRAFNCFWETDKVGIMDYFNRHLFNDFEIKKSGYPKIKNAKYDTIFTSDSLFQKLDILRGFDKLTNRDSFISSQILSYALQFSLSTQEIISTEDEKGLNFFDYICKQTENINHYVIQEINPRD